LKEKLLTLLALDSESGTRAEQAFSAISEMILSGELEPGAIVNEVDLSRRLQMTRGPIREAMMRLEGRKLITREAYQRSRVIEIGPREMREVFEFREGVEGVAARLAALHMSDEKLAHLAARLDARKAGKDPDFDIHWEIASGCGNTRITQTICDEFYYVLRMYRNRSSTNPQRPVEAHEEHRHILRAMQARDAELAESRMRKHIREAELNLATLL
jgi:DNA-binding GntR family transcriptional regulator